MASIISWQFMGLPCSPSTLAAASRALVFLTLGCFLALVGLGFWDAAVFRVGASAAAGMPLASGGGCSLRILFLVVFLLAAMSGLPKRCDSAQRTTRCDTGSGQLPRRRRHLQAIPEKNGSFSPSPPPVLAALRPPENLGLSAGKPLSLPHRPCSVGSE